jgi:hypothetical protein
VKPPNHRGGRFSLPPTCTRADSAGIVRLGKKTKK